MGTKDKVLDIAMNLNRIGNWAADGYHKKGKRIKQFISLTSQSVNQLTPSRFSEPFKKTYKNFIKEYKILEREGLKGPQDELYWAEKMMTWGNILTHRAKLIK